MRATSGDLRVMRTRTGYVAVLRVQGPDGSAVGFESYVSENEVRQAMNAAGVDGVGFSFAKLARSIGRAASSIAKSKVFKTFISAAKFLPPPISSVATAADGAAKVLLAMRKKGDPAALAEWKRAAAVARANPTSPTAAAMRLAMDAVGPPKMRPPVETRRAATGMLRELLASLERENAAPEPPGSAPDAPATPPP